VGVGASRGHQRADAPERKEDRKERKHLRFRVSLRGQPGRDREHCYTEAEDRPGEPGRRPLLHPTGSSDRTGSRPPIVVPIPTAERTSSSPPSADSRSAMPCSPISYAVFFSK